MPTCMPQSPPHPAQLHKWADRAVYAFCVALLLGSLFLVHHTTRREADSINASSSLSTSSSSNTSNAGRLQRRVVASLVYDVANCSNDSSRLTIAGRRHLEHDVDADSSAVPVWQPITWSPENDKYLLATCTHGHVADRVVCLQRYVLVAAMLNRTLVVPENDLCGDARHHANHLDATSTLSGIRSIGSDSRTSNRRHRDFGPPSVSFSRVLNLAKLEQCFSSGNSGSIASSSSSSGGQNAGSGTSSAVEDGRANFARRLSNVPLSDTSENSGGDSGGDSGGNSGGNDERAIMPRVMTLTRFLRLRRMKTVHVDSLVCGHSPGSCSLPSHCASSHRELRENKLYETEVTRVALPRRTDRMSPFASSISDFPRAILTDAPRSYRVSVLSLGDLSNLNASDLLIGADVPYHRIGTGGSISEVTMPRCAWNGGTAILANRVEAARKVWKQQQQRGMRRK
ncbi:unnamed protein product [Closterium sp. NIES-54]